MKLNDLLQRSNCPYFEIYREDSNGIRESLYNSDYVCGVPYVLMNSSVLSFEIQSDMLYVKVDFGGDLYGR